MSVRLATTTQGRSGVELSSVVVVVDVLRALTTAAVAVAKGAGGVVLTGSHRDALRMRGGLPGALVLTDGAPRDGHVHVPACLLPATSPGPMSKIFAGLPADVLW